MTEPQPTPGEIRVNPDGDILAWYWPESRCDPRPWLTLARPLDPDITPDWEWLRADDVTGWRVVGHTAQPQKLVVPRGGALPPPGT